VYISGPCNQVQVFRYQKKKHVTRFNMYGTMQPSTSIQISKKKRTRTHVHVKRRGVHGNMHVWDCIKNICKYVGSSSRGRHVHLWVPLAVVFLQIDLLLLYMIFAIYFTEIGNTWDRLLYQNRFFLGSLIN
jgi:hypothetical protein